MTGVTNNNTKEWVEWEAICRKLNLREETVDGTDEQGMIRNHYAKFFIPRSEIRRIVENINLSTEIEFIKPEDQKGYRRAQTDLLDTLGAMENQG